jgi:hypothetical protein
MNIAFDQLLQFALVLFQQAGHRLPCPRRCYRGGKTPTWNFVG